MCGRVRLGTDFSQIRIKLQFDEAAPVPNVPVSWNVCPTDPMLVAVNENGRRIPQQMRRGLVPWWAKDAVAGELHDRMPVILAPESWERWLGDERTGPEELKALLRPCPDEVLKVWPVDKTKIGKVRYKERDVADPVSVAA